MDKRTNQTKASPVAEAGTTAEHGDLVEHPPHSSVQVLQRNLRRAPVWSSSCSFPVQPLDFLNLPHVLLRRVFIVQRSRRLSMMQDTDVSPPEQTSRQTLMLTHPSAERPSVRNIDEPGGNSSARRGRATWTRGLAGPQVRKALRCQAERRS